MLTSSRPLPLLFVALLFSLVFPRPSPPWVINVIIVQIREFLHHNGAPRDLVFDLTITHERWGDTDDPSKMGKLRHPTYINKPLQEACQEKTCEVSCRIMLTTATSAFCPPSSAPRVASTRSSFACCSTTLTARVSSSSDSRVSKRRLTKTLSSPNAQLSSTVSRKRLDTS